MCDLATDFYLMSAWQNVIQSAIDDTKREEESHVKSDKKTTAHNDNKLTPSFDELRAGYDDDTNTSTPYELKTICESPNIS